MKKPIGAGRFIGNIVGMGIKSISNRDKKEKKAFQKSIMSQQNKLDQQLWFETKETISNFTNEQFEELAEYLNEQVCTGERKFSNPRHEVYSRLKNDMISYQYEKVLRKIKQ